MRRMTYVLALLLFAIASYGQQQRRVAILNTEDDGDPPIELTALIHLTARLQEIALNILPKDNYFIMNEQSIIDMLGSRENARKTCKEAQCLAEIGRKVSADYVGQARLGRLGSNLSINMKLYSSANGALVGSFTGDAKDVFGLIAIINEKASAMFKKMPGVSVGRVIESGIGGIQTASGYYELSEKRYVTNLSTDPPGAVLSFDGVPAASCPKTPCKAELHNGSVRIMANLEQYEIADTVVYIAQNYQNISITLKPNFGILEIKPAYLYGLGEDEPWSLYINDKSASSWENRLLPNKYKVELEHGCYEDLSFEAGINKGKREVFDMAEHIKLKKGGLILSAERDGEPVSEPVFVNSEYAGETPFSDAIPLCAKMEIGKNRRTLDVELKHNENVMYTYKDMPKESMPSDKSYWETIGSVQVGKPTSFWVAIGLDVLGASLIGFAIYENSEMNKSYERYNRNYGSSEYYEDAWKDADSSRKTRNALYIIGGAFLASGIGVHIWF